jgi:hypothetical protein
LLSFFSFFSWPCGLFILALPSLIVIVHWGFILHLFIVGVFTSSYDLNSGLPTPRLPSSLEVSIIFHSADVPLPFQSFHFDFSHSIWWHMHFVVPICFSFCALLVHIFRRFFLPLVNRVDAIFSLWVSKFCCL